MLALSSAFSEATLKALAQKDATITVADGGADYLLRSPLLTVTSVAKPAIVSPNACRIFPQDKRLGNPGTVKAAYVQAFKDVMQHRTTHSWPGGGVSTNPEQVDVLAARYGPYVIIGLVDNFAHRTSCGKFILGCEGNESYRVRTSTSEVLPFEGCVENPNRGLPRLPQLPP
jgi:hypothetical protein